MIVYAYWDDSPTAPPEQAEQVVMFRRAILAEGHIPRLLTAKDALKSSEYKKAKKPVSAANLPRYALHAKKGKLLVSLSLFIP